MSEAKHTPGPWRVRGPYVAKVGAATASQLEIALVCGESNGERDANARLIASAPDLAARVEHLEAVNAKLLAACEAAFVFLNGQYVTGDPAHAIAVESELDAAIKAAKGE